MSKVWQIVWAVTVGVWAVSFIAAASLYSDMRERVYRNDIRYDALWCVWGSHEMIVPPREDCTVNHMKRFGADAIMRYTDDSGHELTIEEAELAVKRRNATTQEQPE